MAIAALVLVACLCSSLLGAWLYSRGQKGESPIPQRVVKHKARPPKRDEDEED